MRIKVLLAAVMITASNAFCQKIFFNGFGNEYKVYGQGKVVNKESSQNTNVSINTPVVEGSDTQQTVDNIYVDSDSTMLSSSMNHNKVNRSRGKGLSVSSSTKKTDKKLKDNHRLRLYEGDSRPLTMSNILAVMEEVGVSNRIIVLAQSLLETGFFKSNVCKTQNNLFGLYDSRNKRYYSFERWEDSVVGYRKFIQYRYKSGNYFAFLRRIGYAEDPQYITKVGKITKKLCKEGIILD